MEADRVVVDMAPSGHTLNLFGLMAFLDEFLKALELFQEKHRVISQSFTGRYTADAADAVSCTDMKSDLSRRTAATAESRFYCVPGSRDRRTYEPFGNPTVSRRAGCVENSQSVACL